MDLAAAFALLDSEPVYYWQDVDGDDQPEQMVVTPWPEWWLTSFKPALMVPSARDYLTGRGVSPALMQAFDIRYDSARHAVCFPVRNRDGELCGMRGRFIVPRNERRYHDYDYKGQRNTHLLWFNEDRLDWSRTVVVCEGAFDAVAIYRWYRNVTSGLSATMSLSKISELANAVEVVCCFDPDEAGRLAYQKVRKVLSPGTVVRSVTWPEEIDYASAKWDASKLDMDILGHMLSTVIKLDELIP